jgi:pimeloyl-ACP methyl ester carboxylesterase
MRCEFVVQTENTSVELSDCQIQVRWLTPISATEQTVVFLHEGLGSATSWGPFPLLLCERTNSRVLLYSRLGHGNSRPARVGPNLGFLQQEAFEILPKLLDRLNIRNPVLYGHSDGATIALLYASKHPIPGAIIEAPHVFLEAKTLDGIAEADALWRAGSLGPRLARHHSASDPLFTSWRDTWRQLAETGWNIDSQLGKIQCPLLLIQGEQDAYGTPEQLTRISRAVKGAVSIRTFINCGHFPHRERQDLVTGLCGRFITGLNLPARSPKA